MATTPASAFFIQPDTPAQDFATLAITRGCWEYITEKMLAVILLAPLFWLFGPSPVWETVLLAIAFVISGLTVYELGRLFTDSILGGVLAVLTMMTTPAFQLFSRTYLGYLAPCLLLGWLALHHRHWGWTGFAFGCSILAHFNALVPVGLSCLWLVVFQLRYEKWKRWLRFLIGAAVPLIIIEALFFAYMGIPLQWTRGTISIITRFSGINGGVVEPNAFWLINTVVASNGIAPSLLLAIGLAAPLAFRHHKTALSISLTFISLAIWYTIQSSLGRSLMASRLLASAYPFWALCAALVLFSVLRHIPRSPQQITSGLAVIALTLLVTRTGIFIRNFTETLNPQLATWFTRAAQAGHPVRYMGNSWIALFYAQSKGVEILVGDERWANSNAPGQAVLIFSGSLPPAELSRTGYNISSVAIVDAPDALYSTLTTEAAIARHAELWWPSGPPNSVKPNSPPDTTNAAYYYPGSGCLTPPPYRYGTMYFYQLVLHKIAERLSAK